jgi:hypothetical protein
MKLRRPKGWAAESRKLVAEACKLGCPDEYVSRLAKQLGVEGRPRNARHRVKSVAGLPTGEKWNIAMQCLSDNPEMSGRELAKRCHVSRQTIMCWRQKPEFGARLKEFSAKWASIRKKFEVISGSERAEMVGGRHDMSDHLQNVD